MNMAVAEGGRGVRLRPPAATAAGTFLMTELSDEAASQAITVLLVEDDAPTLWRLQDALAKAGFQVTAAPTLAQAPAPPADGRPKVLLTGPQMPDGHRGGLTPGAPPRLPQTANTVSS